MFLKKFRLPLFSNRQREKFLLKHIMSNNIKEVEWFYDKYKNFKCIDKPYWLIKCIGIETIVYIVQRGIIPNSILIENKVTCKHSDYLYLRKMGITVYFTDIVKFY